MIKKKKGVKIMKKIFLLCLIAIISLLLMGSVALSQTEIDFSFNNELVILYKVGNNDITIEVEKSKVSDYINTYEWTLEPTVLMYAVDGRTLWVVESEVYLYSQVYWSIYPPITLYCNGGSMAVFLNEKEKYLSTGQWFETYEEANPCIFTYNVFTKSNLTVEQLNKILSGTGLENCGIYFYNMEKTWNVNSLFAVAVACHESANGFRKANTHNYFGFKGKNGTWMKFSSQEECINYFGELMNKKRYYGKTMKQISVIYCDSSWEYKVKRHMNEKWNKL